MKQLRRIRVPHPREEEREGEEREVQEEAVEGGERGV